MYLLRHCLTAAAALLLLAVTAHAQPVHAGDAIVTCEANQPGDPTVGGIALEHANTAPANANWAPPMYHGSAWNRTRTGQLFGIALDGSWNIFVTATAIYNNKTWGSAGMGGIYRIDGVSPAGTISDFILTNASASYVAGSNKLPNTGPGLGNICFDPDHTPAGSSGGQFFVTNFEDGAIYRIANGATGTILTWYHPVGSDAGAPGWAPLGERLWGIGYYQGRVYYSVWQVDCGYLGSGLFNTIRSVALKPNGDFDPVTDRLEITLPYLPGQHHSNPVSDIEFSRGGKMLLGERTISSSGLTGAPTSYAHASRVLEYERIGSAWLPTSHTFSIGALNVSYHCPIPSPSFGAGCAGGVDYGFSGMDTVRKFPRTLNCDSTIWSTGDCLGPNNSCSVYGLQGTKATGGTAMQSVLIDFGNPAKTQIGDVDVVRACDAAPINPCDSIRLTAVMNQKYETIFCCWNVTVTNNSGAPVYTDITAHITTPGVSFANGSVAIPPGWTITQLSPDVIFHYVGGAGIPTGATGPLQFCLDVGATTTQQILFTLSGPNLPPCTKTLGFDCRRSSAPGCAVLKDLQIACKKVDAANATYTLTFAIKNLSAFTATGGHFIVSSPAGATIAPSSTIFTPTLPPNGTSAVQSLTVTVPTSATSNTLCLKVVPHEGEQICLNACNLDTCIVLPPCRDCCSGTDQRISTTSVGQLSGGIVGLTLTANPPPGTIRAAASVVSAFRMTFAGYRCSGSGWLPVPASIVLPQAAWGGLPLMPSPPPPFGTAPPGPYADAMWGTIPAGVSLAGQPLDLQIQFPDPPPSFHCRDQLRFCVRYSFTDTKCVTCDTMVCYVVTRIGGFILSDRKGDILLRGIRLEGPVAHEEQIDPDRAKGEDREIAGAADDGELARIEMASATSGTLRVTLPSSGAGDSVEHLTIVGIDLQPAPPVRLDAMTEVGKTHAADILEGTARIGTSIAEGESSDFSLTYINPNRLGYFLNLIRFRMTLSGHPGDTLESDWQEIYARVPGSPGGDTIGEEHALPRPPHARTFALYFRNANAFGQPIGEVTLSLKGSGAILAVGPPADSAQVSLVPVRLDSARLMLTQGYAAEAATAIPAGDSLRPIYLTVAADSGTKEITIHYVTRSASGAIISEGDAVLVTPIASTRERDPIATGASAILLAPVPNPTSNAATVTFHLPAGATVTLGIFDMAGNEVARPMEAERLPAGDHSVIIPTSGLPSGSYIVRLRAGQSALTQGMRVVR